MSDRAMSLKDAAAYLGIALGTLQNWHTKRIGPPYYKMGSKIVYREKELKRWMDERRFDPEKERSA